MDYTLFDGSGFEIMLVFTQLKKLYQNQPLKVVMMRT